ncbi:Hpr1p [Saccharomyces eubayanus]|uniref:Hpr1p n=1 Tax=Saccharomyces eubayanus TaxID=1080349 RepID=UPI0006C34301|nr:HPR1-like protein [Saccharomyces eubayanus]KOH00984.1 HPR1-like protein [Saccharomyces eubayanus]
MATTTPVTYWMILDDFYTFLIDITTIPRRKMADVEELIQDSVGFLHKTFDALPTSLHSIKNEPLSSTLFDDSILNFEWEPLKNCISMVHDRDLLVDTVLKKFIIDSMTNAIEDDEVNNFERGLLNSCICLDFVYNARRNRKTPSTWGNTFFDLFSTTIDLLNSPSSFLKFWPYAESRIEWFKMNTSVEPILFGESNLISYKQPLYEKLRHWNDVLAKLENNDMLNTTKHFNMKFKLENFLSELLPINEESNFNRSASISALQYSDSKWNKTISGRESSHNSDAIFSADYNFVFENLITRPIEFAFSDVEFKNDVDRSLAPLLDAILEIEEGFYGKIKKNNKTRFALEETLNNEYYANYDVMTPTLPVYMKQSSSMKMDRNEFWLDLQNIKESRDFLLRPTIMDISLSNTNSLYRQLTQEDDDYYRKQFILQLCFTVNLVRNLISSEETRHFYKSCYLRENPMSHINFENLDENNKKRGLNLCSYICDNRILKFYKIKDPDFHSIVQKLLSSDENFVTAKIDGFKEFQSFKISNEKISSPNFDKSFKKFTFVKMGNKSINSIWKIATGLDKIERDLKKPEGVYEAAHSKWESKVSAEAPSEEAKDEIIRQWQTLRFLRSQYLFDFNKVNENTGVDGLFESYEKAEVLNNDIKKKLLCKINQGHKKKLQEAKEYRIGKEQKKRALEEGPLCSEEKDIKLKRLDDSSLADGDELKRKTAASGQEPIEENAKVAVADIPSQYPGETTEKKVFSSHSNIAQSENAENNSM